MNQQKRVSFTGLRRLYEDTPDKGNSGSTMKRIGTGLLAILVLAVLAVGYKVYQAPWALSVFGTAFKAGYQFGSPVAISLDNRQLVTVTVYRPKVPGDSAGRAHYARNVAAFVYDRFPQAPGDSIKQLAVELRGVKTYRLTPAQIKDTTALPLAPAPRWIRHDDHGGQYTRVRAERVPVGRDDVSDQDGAGNEDEGRSGGRRSGQAAAGAGAHQSPRPGRHLGAQHDARG